MSEKLKCPFCGSDITLYTATPIDNKPFKKWGILIFCNNCNMSITKSYQFSKGIINDTSYEIEKFHRKLFKKFRKFLSTIITEVQNEAQA